MIHLLAAYAILILHLLFICLVMFGAVAALRAYRAHFVPTPFGTGQPRAMLGINASVGATAEEAARLVLSVKGYYNRLRQGKFKSFVPTMHCPCTSAGRTSTIRLTTRSR